MAAGGGDVGGSGFDAYMDGSYKLANPTWGRERADWKARQVVELLRKHQVMPASILDVGCGTGLVLTAVGEALGSATLIGVEPSSDAPIDEGVQQKATIRSCMLGDIEDRTDLVMLLDVFEHVEDQIGLIREAAAHANKWIIFHVPLEICVIEVAFGFLGRSNETVKHIHYFSDRTALIALKTAGLRDIVGVRYTPSGFDGPTRKHLSPLNLVRRFMFKISPGVTARWLGGVSLAVLARV